MPDIKVNAVRCCLAALVAAVFGAMPAAAQPYHEAPMLAERVARGDLPPVEERLPEAPVVVEPVDSIGKYGGTWRRVATGPSDIQLNSRLGYEPLVRWGRSGRGVEPGLAERWEARDGGKTFVFHLRRGLRWSDGEPLTSEDFLFYYEDVLLNKELSPVFPSWLSIAGHPVTMSADDAHTLRFEFVEPYAIFLEVLCYRGHWILLPKHYLRQFHTTYVDEETLLGQARERGFQKWFELFRDKANCERNPDLPTWRPFKIKVPPPATRMIAERNPFYWKVDPEGNQLPYIDEIAFTEVNKATATFKAMAGEVDFQARSLDAADFPLYMANRGKGKYRVLRDASPGTVVLYINQYSKDDKLRALLQDKRFRVALSVAINREELIDLIYSGMAERSRGVVSPYDPCYLPEFDEKHIDYDPALANKLLDELGMTRGFSGVRRLPGGRPFRQLLNVYPSESGTGEELWQLVADYFREVGLDFTVKVDARTLSVMQVRNGNSDFWGYATAGMHWVLDPLWYVPWQSTSYFAPLYGRYVASSGRDAKGVKPPEEFQRMLDWYLELRACPDEQRRVELGQRVLRQWADECYTIGICRQELITIVADRFKNAPDRIIHSWRLMTPGYIGIEQFYIDDSSAAIAQAGGRVRQ